MLRKFVMQLDGERSTREYRRRFSPLVRNQATGEAAPGLRRLIHSKQAGPASRKTSLFGAQVLAERGVRTKNLAHLLIPSTEIPDRPTPDRSGSPRILCVDDSAIQLRILAHFLAKHGYQPHCVKNGQQALTVLSENPGAFDVLITDYQMPGMDGAELASCAIHLGVIQRIICLTASAEVPERPATDGYYCLISKPFRPKQLLTAIEKSLQWISPSHGWPLAFEV